MYISKLCEENAVNGVIKKITEDFEEIVGVTKSNQLKRYAKNILPNYKTWRKQEVENRNKRIKKQK